MHMTPNDWIVYKLPGIIEIGYSPALKRLSAPPIDNNEIRLANILLARGVELVELREAIEVGPFQIGLDGIIAALGSEAA
jgi:hypothetical protein